MKDVAHVALFIPATPVTDSRLLNAQARQERVKVLLTRNLSLVEIADAVGASLRTINYDVKQIRQDAAECLSRTNVLDLAAMLWIRSEARHRELWLLFSRVHAAERTGITIPVAVALQLNILKELSRQSAKDLEILLKLGVVIPADRELMLGMKAVTMLNSLSASDLERALSQDTEQFLEMLVVRLGDEAVAELFAVKSTWPRTGTRRPGSVTPELEPSLVGFDEFSSAAEFL